MPQWAGVSSRRREQLPARCEARPLWVGANDYSRDTYHSGSSAISFCKHCNARDAPANSAEPAGLRAKRGPSRIALNACRCGTYRSGWKFDRHAAAGARRRREPGNVRRMDSPQICRTGKTPGRRRTPQQTGRQASRPLTASAQQPEPCESAARPGVVLGEQVQRTRCPVSATPCPAVFGLASERCS